MMIIGEKLKHLRQQLNLTQEEMADRCELSKGFISQVERDLASPSIATLTDMLECLGTTLQEFFTQEEPKKVVYSKEDMFVKEDVETLNGNITWLIPNAQKNEMEPILLTLGQGGESYPVAPHEGEEFGYVLQGSVTLHLGKKKHTLKQGESFCIKPEQTHYFTNKGQRIAKILWVSTPPIF